MLEPTVCILTTYQGMIYVAVVVYCVRGAGREYVPVHGGLTIDDSKPGIHDSRAIYTR